MQLCTRFVSLTLAVIALAHLTSAANGAGLLAPTNVTLPPLRITDHSVEATVRDHLAITTVRQTFRNDTNQRLEATYVFPLPENADVTGFQMSFNGKMVQGEVLPAEQAKEVYERIVRQAKDPGLIEFIGRRLLQMRVFPIEPNSDTTIELKYQQVCSPVSGMHAYHYPLRTPSATGQAHGAVRFAVNLETQSPLKSIWSPTHSVEIVREGEHKAKIAYETTSASLDDDFLLLYGTDESDLGLSVVAHKPSDKEAGHFVLLLTPKQLWPESERGGQDVVFVIDTSGSMAGEKMEQARHALQYCVEQLDERDRFNVVRFSTGFDPLFPELRDASKEHRAEAQNAIAEYKAMGGTNIADTLEWVFAHRPHDPGDAAARPFLVVFLTDGRGNQNVEQVMTRLAKVEGEHAAVRIFPFGVGHDVDTIMLDRLANTYSGRPTYVQPGENLELVLGDFFSVVSKPVLTSLSLTLPDIGVTERFPVTLGDLYHGQQIIVAAKFDRPATGPVKLTAKRGDETVEYVWPSVSFTHAPGADYVPAIWAGRKIAFLVDQIRLHGENEEMVSEIIALGQQYGIQTPYTSWLVAPEGDQQWHFAWQAAQRASGGAGGGGGGGMPAMAPSAQRERLGRVTVGTSFDGDSESGATDEDVRGYRELELAMKESAGKAATTLAASNARLRDLASADTSRVSRRQFAVQKIGDRWFNRIGPFLVDQQFGEKASVTIVKFGSDAYFALAARADLRPVLAASKEVVVLVAENQAVLVSESEGLEKFSAEQVEQLGLGERSHN